MHKNAILMKENHKVLYSFIWLLLITGVCVVYGHVGGFKFIRYDEELYITQNPHVLSGIRLEGFRWALTTLDAGNWHPLTWLSLMLDHDLYGMNAGGYHWTNVVLHLAGGLVLFVALSRMTGYPWRSFAVVGLFLLHPLHVESVAWVAERKDVLSGLFWMLSLWGYARYVEKPCPGRYLWVVLFFALGLMSKPMVVTLPFVLLLMDYWPLKRMGKDHGADAGSAEIGPTEESKDESRGAFSAGTGYRLVLEKVPLLLLSLFTVFMTLKAQNGAGALVPFDGMPLAARLGNALVAYTLYLKKAIWPTGLAVFYPHPADRPYWLVWITGTLLIVITVWTWRRRRSDPYLPVGWLWFLGTLVPVIGIVQVGAQAMADRYTYLPLIGLSLMVVWGSVEGFKRLPYPRVWPKAVWGLLLIALIGVSFRQTQYWEDSLKLFRHAIGVTEGNYLAHNNYGAALMDEGDIQRATVHFQEALRIRPDFAEALSNMGNIMALQGDREAAARYFRETVRIKPDYPGAKRRLGDVLQQMGRMEEAIACYGEALVSNPDDPVLHNNLAVALASIGEKAKAMAQLKRALDLKADYPDARRNLDWLTKRGSTEVPYKGGSRGEGR